MLFLPLECEHFPENRCQPLSSLTYSVVNWPVPMQTLNLKPTPSSSEGNLICYKSTRGGSHEKRSVSPCSVSISGYIKYVVVSSATGASTIASQGHIIDATTRASTRTGAAIYQRLLRPFSKR